MRLARRLFLAPFASEPRLAQAFATEAGAIARAVRHAAAHLFLAGRAFRAGLAFALGVSAERGQANAVSTA